jgi:TonB family protein
MSACGILLLTATLGAGQEGRVVGGGLHEACELCKVDGVIRDFDQPPRPVRITRPRYPKEAFAKRIEGTVVIEIIVDAKGRVGRHRIVTSIPALDAAAVETVKTWVFSPAMKKGRPVAAVARAPITFSLGGQRMGPLFFDPEGADFTAWINHFKNETYRNWIVPQEAAKQGLRSHVDLEMIVERDGSSSSIRLLKSSGTPTLDRGAENALRSSRFLPLPTDFPSPRVTMQVTFFYNEGLRPPEPEGKKE